jgi:hypothetical protein
MADVDLGPGELDLLEDALEELELVGSLDHWSEDELDPRVRARLVDYRSVLAAARQALPLEDVPAGVLDDVLAQARQAAAAPAAAVAAAHEPWWARLRRSFMVPALALAGTAALVLWVFDPESPGTLADSPAGPAPDAKRTSVAAERPDGGEREQAEATPVAPAAAPTAASDAAVDAKPNDEEVDGGGADKKDVAAEAKLDAAKNAEPNQPTEGRGMTSLGDVPGALGGAGGAAAGATPGQPQAQTKAGDQSGGSASGRWDIVVRGDRARQAGDCVAARDEYALALEDDEPRVRARAFAGIGLCDAAAGDEASADANYERARALDDAVDGFIESQNERSRGAAKQRKSKPKKSKTQPDAFDDASDPFG